MDHKGLQRHLSDSIVMQYNTFAVLMGDDKTVVTRGCTALENEDLYKCDMHTAGNQASRNGDKQKVHHFRFSRSATAMGMAATKIGTLLGRRARLK